MSGKVSKIIRASVIALMAGVAPVASAMAGQAVAEPQQGNSPAALIDAAASQRPVGQPASMTGNAVAPSDARVATVAPTMLGQAVAEGARQVEAERAAMAAFEDEVADLRPGQYVWHPERATSGTMEMVVSIPAQRIYVYRGGTLIGVSTVSTGRAGHSTPTGTFPIIEKRRVHFSNLYNNAPMPNMQRLTYGGIALHAGVIPGYPASHGCVRLPLAFSRILFDNTSRGERVHIVANRPETAHQAIALVRTPRSGQQVASAAR